MADEALKITLSKPLRLSKDDDPVKVLEMHPFCAGDIEDVGFPLNVGGYLRMAAASSGQPLALVRRLSMSDFPKVSAAVDTFFGSGPATGSK